MPAGHGCWSLLWRCGRAEWVGPAAADGQRCAVHPSELAHGAAARRGLCAHERRGVEAPSATAHLGVTGYAGDVGAHGRVARPRSCTTRGGTPRTPGMTVTAGDHLRAARGRG